MISALESQRNYEMMQNTKKNKGTTEMIISYQVKTVVNMDVSCVLNLVMAVGGAQS